MKTSLQESGQEDRERDRKRGRERIYKITEIVRLPLSSIRKGEKNQIERKQQKKERERERERERNK